MNESKLIIVGSYVCENVSGSHRQERYIIRALELGFKVILIKPSGNWKGVHEFKCLSEFDSWRKSNILLNYSGSVSISKYKKYLIPIKQILLIDLFGYGFFRTFIYLVKNKKYFSNRYSIIASSPQISVAYAVYLFKSLLMNSLNYNIDMRDAWAKHKIVKYHKLLRSHIEDSILKNAQNVVTVSKYLKDEFEHSYNIKVNLLYNVNVRLLREFSINNNIYDNPFDDSLINICYFGSLPRGFYDLNEFCLGLQGYLNSNHSERKIIFHFYGPCVELEVILSKFPKVSKVCIFNSSISHHDAIRLMHFCDAVLFFGFNDEKNAGVVSTKIFEYFFLKIRIIAFGIRENSDLDYLFSNSCGFSVILNDHISFRNYLLLTFENLSKLPFCRNMNFLFELDSQYDKFLMSLK